MRLRMNKMQVVPCNGRLKYSWCQNGKVSPHFAKNDRHLGANTQPKMTQATFHRGNYDKAQVRWNRAKEYPFLQH